jgi:hypothetical protein
MVVEVPTSAALKKYSGGLHKPPQSFWDSAIQAVAAEFPEKTALAGWT